MTTHPMSRHLTRAFLYISGQEGVWETLRPTARDEVRSFHPQLITSLLAIGHLQLLCETGDATAGVSAFSSKEQMGTLAWDVSVVTQHLILCIKTSKMPRICNQRQFKISSLLLKAGIPRVLMREELLFFPHWTGHGRKCWYWGEAGAGGRHICCVLMWGMDGISEYWRHRVYKLLASSLVLKCNAKTSNFLKHKP